MEENTYYVHHRDGETYYYNPQTQETTNSFPTNAVVRDPETNEVVKKPNTTIRRRTSTTMTKKSKMNASAAGKITAAQDDSNNAADEPKKKRKIVRLKAIKTTKKKKTSSPPSPTPVKKSESRKFTEIGEDNGKPLFYPKDIEADANGAKVDGLFDYIVENKMGRKSSQSRVFQNKPLIVTFLKMEKSQAKIAFLIFKTILKYQGVRKSKKVDGTLSGFIEYIQKDSCLIDEAYLYVLKQTTTSDHDESFKKGLEMLLVLIDTFTPKSEFCPYILSHVARIHQSVTNESLKNFAFYLYLRCRSQFFNDSPIVVPLDQILTSITDSRRQFNVSLNEIMWNQKDTYPKLPLPAIIVKIISELVQKDCAHTQGIFRLSGNTNNLDKLKASSNSGDFEFLKSCDIHDISSLFKSWLRNISGSILPAEFVPVIQNHKKSPSIDVVDSLPVVNRNVLMYLVGFLQKQQQTSDETMMDISNLAMVFSPNLVHQDNDPSINVLLTSHTQGFIEYLIHEWDTSSIYPLPPEYNI